RTYDIAGVTEKFGVPPVQVKEWLALVGDTSDNVPGGAGVGAKTAGKLLPGFGSLDALLEPQGELKGKLREAFEDPERRARLARSRELVALHADVPLPADISEYTARPWDGRRLRELFEELEFQVLLERLGARTAGEELPAPAPVGIELPPAEICRGPE